MPVPDVECQPPDARSYLTSDLRHLSSESALTERPACFEIDPRGACGQAAPWMWIARDLRRGDFFGSIPSSRCQTTRALDVVGPRPADAQRTQTCFFSDERRSCWWSQTGSNRRPPACKAGALPTELWPRAVISDQWSVTRKNLITGH